MHEVFRYGLKKHALGRWFHRGRLGDNQPARLSDRRERPAHRRIRGSQGGFFRCRREAFPRRSREIRQRLGDKPLLLAGMVGSNRGWKEAPYVPCPAGIDDLVHALVRPGEREAIVPGVSYVGAGRADVMRGEEVQLLGAVAAGLVEPEALVCHPGTHNKWTVLHQGRIQSFRTVMTGELFSLLKEHSILADLLQGEVAANDVFKEAARHAVFNEALPADLFAVRARVLLGEAKTRGCGILSERLADRHRRANRPHRSHRRAVLPSWAGRTSRNFTLRRSRKRNARRSNSTVNNASSPAFMRSRKGSTIERKRAVSAVSRTMSADRDHSRRHPGRGGRDRRCDLRKWHPDRRSAAELARCAGEHRAAGQAPRRANAGWRRHGPDSRGCRPMSATPEDGSSSRQTPTATSSPKRRRRA